MITESQVYWITRLDQLNVLFALFLVGGIAGAVLTWITLDQVTIKHWLIAACVSLFGLLGLTFIPTTKEMALIKIIPAISNSKFVAEDLPKDARQLYELSKKALIEKLTGEEEKK